MSCFSHPGTPPWDPTQPGIGQPHSEHQQYSKLQYLPLAEPGQGPSFSSPDLPRTSLPAVHTQRCPQPAHLLLPGWGSPATLLRCPQRSRPGSLLSDPAPFSFHPRSHASSRATWSRRSTHATLDTFVDRLGRGPQRGPGSMLRKPRSYPCGAGHPRSGRHSPGIPSLGKGSVSFPGRNTTKPGPGSVGKAWPRPGRHSSDQ